LRRIAKTAADGVPPPPHPSPVKAAGKEEFDGAMER
jgi:hypothetical protein